MGLVMEFTLYANYIPYTCAREGPATALPAECRAPADEVGSPRMLGLNKSTVPNCGCHFMVICPVDMVKNWKQYVAIQSFPVSKSRLYHVLPHLLLLSRSGKWRRREEEVKSQPCKSRLGGSYLWDDVGWTSIYFPRSFMKCTSYRREPTLRYWPMVRWCHIMP